MPTIEVRVPDIGDFKDVGVVEVLVKPGDAVAHDQSLVTLESDKATMDVPSPVRRHGARGEDEGGRPGEGGVAHRPAGGGGVQPRHPAAAAAVRPRSPSAPQPSASQPSGSHRRPPAQPSAPSRPPRSRPAPQPAVRPSAAGSVHASPVGAPLRPRAGRRPVRAVVTGTGPHGRILHEDVQKFVKAALAGGGPRAAAAASTCSPGRRSTSPVRPGGAPAALAASARSPAPTWPATG